MFVENRSPRWNPFIVIQQTNKIISLIFRSNKSKQEENILQKKKVFIFYTKDYSLKLISVNLYWIYNSRERCLEHEVEESLSRIS